MKALQSPLSCDLQHASMGILGENIPIFLRAMPHRVVLSSISTQLANVCLHQPHHVRCNCGRSIFSGSVSWCSTTCVASCILRLWIGWMPRISQPHFRFVISHPGHLAFQLVMIQPLNLGDSTNQPGKRDCGIRQHSCMYGKSSYAQRFRTCSNGRDSSGGPRLVALFFTRSVI